LEDQQVGDEKVVLRQPDFEGSGGKGALAHRVQERMPASSSPRSWVALEQL
jgi:hypothetical protein